MNPFEKIYCRVFQAAFHLALPLLPYREPQLISGICQLGPVLKEKICGRCFWSPIPF